MSGTDFDPDAFEAMSFDCYGTLIDWETGLWRALESWLDGRLPIDREAALEAYGRAETAVEHESPGLLYSDVLGEVHRRLAAEWGLEVTAPERARFAASIADWPAFEDSRAALARLARRYRLFVLSNVDHRSFAPSAEKLGSPFEAVFTAEDIGSYKPAPANFTYLIDRLGERGVAPGRLLHVAQSLFHDIEPAGRMGLATCWIDRRAGVEGGGATPATTNVVRPRFRYESLADLAAAVEGPD